MQIPMWVKRVIKPARIVRIYRTLGQRKREPIRILDVGCGPNVMYTKPYFNVREYHGVDRGMRPGFEANYRNMDKLFCMDLEHLELAEIPDGHYDLVILSHVIEHLSNGLELIRKISAKVAPRGCIYIESPSMRTINYPSALGFMNFYDDPTHKRLYSDQEVIRSLQSCDLRVTHVGYRWSWPRAVLVPPVSVLLNLFYYVPFKRKISSWGLWELLGIARAWVAVRES